MRKDTMKTLILEEQELTKKIKKANENGDYGTYKNLVQALEKILSLQEKENMKQPLSKTMWSKYKMVKKGKEINVISIWEQSSERIKNHRVFEINKEITKSDNAIIDITDYVLAYENFYNYQGYKLKINKNIFKTYITDDIYEIEKIIYLNKIYRITSIDYTDKDFLYISIELVE